MVKPIAVCATSTWKSDRFQTVPSLMLPVCEKVDGNVWDIRPMMSYNMQDGGYSTIGRWCLAGLVTKRIRGWVSIMSDSDCVRELLDQNKAERNLHYEVER